MNTNHILLKRIEHLLLLADKSLQTRYRTEDSIQYFHWVTSESYTEFETSCMSFVLDLYGDRHPYYIRFKETVNAPKPNAVESGKGIINSIKTEIEQGWLTTVKGLVSAEIFTDFLETAEYLLEQKYKDPAAVIIGSTLEEHLRQLCRKHNIAVEDIKNERSVPKKADALNSDLAKNNIYNKLDQKSVTAWLDLRNKAAHGNYSEYGQNQVENMLNGVIEFMRRNGI